MLLNANLTMPPGTAGEAVVAFATAQAAMRVGPATVAAAFKRLAESGFIKLKRPGVRPGAAGGGQRRGKAAVYELPHRTSSAPRLDWSPALQAAGIKRPDGKLRLPSDRIKADVSELSGIALRILYLIAAMKKRDASGALLDKEPEPIGPARLASLAGVGRASAARALGELVKAGRLHIAAPGRGSAPARYALASAYHRKERSCRRLPRPGTGPAPLRDAA
jgi:hypothetical protein